MNKTPVQATHDTLQDAHLFWETYLLAQDQPAQESFWQHYETSVRQARSQQKQQVVKANNNPVLGVDRAIAAPQLFTIDPNQRQPFLKKLWAHQAWPILQAFTVAWIAMSVFFSVVNRDENLYQLLSISAVLLLLFIVGIAYYYWVICCPLAGMQLIIDCLGIMREGAGLDHLSIKYSEIVDIKQNPLGLQIRLKPKGRIQEDLESVLLPRALLDYSLVCDLLERHLAFNNQYYSFCVDEAY